MQKEHLTELFYHFHNTHWFGGLFSFQSVMNFIELRDEPTNGKYKNIDPDPRKR